MTSILLKNNRTRHMTLLQRGYKLNCVRINVGQDPTNPKSHLPHEEAKFATAFQLQANGHWYVTEAVFAPPFKGRADVYDLDTGHIIEILHNETVNQAIRKTEKYPPVNITLMNTDCELLAYRKAGRWFGPGGTTWPIETEQASPSARTE